MIAAPVPLARPVLLLNGYRGFSGLALSVRDLLATLTSTDRNDFIVVSYATLGDIESITRRVMSLVRDRLGIDPDSKVSPAMDVLGISMGGVLARWCAMDADTRVFAKQHVPELRSSRKSSPLHIDVARAFTFGSPHRGAILADRIAPDSAARCMRSNSPWLLAMDAYQRQNPIDLTCYTLLKDRWVGATRTAPPGMHPVWMRGPSIMAHFSAPRWEPFVLDVARRLRGERPLLREDAASQPPHD